MIYGVVDVLVTEYFQCNSRKIIFCYRKYFGGKVSIFSRAIQFLSKFGYNNAKMRYALIITITCLLFVSCKKDNSTPATLTYKSVSTTVLFTGQQMVFTLGFTDPSASIDSIFMQCVIPDCANSCFRDSDALPPLTLVPGQSGDITITYGYANTAVYHKLKDPQCLINDTGYFRFELKNAAGRLSDTVNSPTIVIVK